MSKFKKGDRVDYHSIIGGPVTIENTEVTEDQFTSLAGHEVCFIKGKSGYVAVEALTRVPESEDKVNDN